jgi:hypothetical protein
MRGCERTSVVFRFLLPVCSVAAWLSSPPAFGVEANLDVDSQIEAELRRQEALLKQIDAHQAVGGADSQAAPSAGLASPDPRDAPLAPVARILPESIFTQSRRRIAKGEWGNDTALDVVVRSLDADRDGAPEEIRYYDARTGALLRLEEDTDYDGRIDRWTRYQAGAVAEVERDTDGDGRIDERQWYGSDGRMTRREVDRDGDGVCDASYLYADGALVEERYAGKQGGEPERIVHYRGRRLVSTEEDVDHDGRMDTWTTFEVDADRERIARIERDTNGDGKPDTFESYEQIAGRPVLVERDEDKNGDGHIDVRSLYQNGKLARREIGSPALLTP